MTSIPHPKILDSQRLATLESTGLLDSPPEAAFDRLTKLATKILNTPVALVSLVGPDRQFFKSQVGLPEPWAEQRQTPLSHSFCQFVVSSGKNLVVRDAREDPRLKDNGAVHDLSVVAYAGIPLNAPNGETLGSFCAIDCKPRKWTQREVEILEDLAGAARAEIELRLRVQELNVSNEKLRRSEMLRHDLTDMMVHDLRTPLTSLMAGVQSLPILGTLTEGQQGLLQLATRGGGRMLDMINELLDISRMESGDENLNLSQVDIRQQITDAAHEMAPLLADKKQTLVQDVPENLPCWSADGELLRRVFNNLLGNANKFTPAGGQIAVKVGVKPGETGINLLVQVTDTGEGIPQEALERIFDKFGQVENRKANRRYSTGLGLTLCRMIIEAHGGHIWATSEAGQGSTFSFTLPA